MSHVIGDRCDQRVAWDPGQSAGVSSRVAPVPAIRLDPVGREDLAGVEGDERDLVLVDDGEDAPAGVGNAGVQVVQPASSPQGHGALAVGDVVAEAELAPATCPCGQCLGRRPVPLAGCRPTDRPVRPLLVVRERECVELGLQRGQVGRRRLPPEPALEGLLEALSCCRLILYSAGGGDGQLLRDDL